MTIDPFPCNKSTSLLSVKVNSCQSRGSRALRTAVMLSFLFYIWYYHKHARLLSPTLSLVKLVSSYEVAHNKRLAEYKSRPMNFWGRIFSFVLAAHYCCVPLVVVSCFSRVCERACLCELQKKSFIGFCNAAVEDVCSRLKIPTAIFWRLNFKYPCATIFEKFVITGTNWTVRWTRLASFEAQSLKAFRLAAASLLVPSL